MILFRGVNRETGSENVPEVSLFENNTAYRSEGYSSLTYSEPPRRRVAWNRYCARYFSLSSDTSAITNANVIRNVRHDFVKIVFWDS